MELSIISRHFRTNYLILKKIRTELIRQKITYKDLGQNLSRSKSVYQKTFMPNSKKSKIDFSIIKEVSDYLNLNYREILYKNPVDYIDPKLSTLQKIIILFSELGISKQNVIAKKLGLSVASYNNLLLGKTINLSENIAERAANFFGITRESLISKEVPISILDIIQQVKVETPIFHYPLLNSKMAINYHEIKPYLNIKRVNYIQSDEGLDNAFFIKWDTNDYTISFPKETLLLIDPDIKSESALKLETNHQYLARDIDLSLWVVESKTINDERVWVDMKTHEPLDVRLIGQIVSRQYPV
ncbi:hypothetical protein CF386_09695 [Paraphotobacterium marinum]|uniref:HTH cro/C1-type domain-containing protein n=1 Tax=Paraphotobacterium marinum TaxID=1755811 RepID=A0A220VG71_9GAMM|nr:hypothetical protein [Paraphotobacterium marinum]ASK79329.1 hypothetical protein CF386_09695 [Paraphotobacterium marinum]